MIAPFKMAAPCLKYKMKGWTAKSSNGEDSRERDKRKYDQTFRKYCLQYIYDLSCPDEILFVRFLQKSYNFVTLRLSHSAFGGQNIHVGYQCAFGSYAAFIYKFKTLNFNSLNGRTHSAPYGGYLWMLTYP